MTRSVADEELSEAIEAHNPESLTADGFNDAIIGMSYRCGQDPIVAYSFAKCVAILVERDGMTHTEAAEYLEFNTVGAYVGENTPCFIYDLV